LLNAQVERKTRNGAWILYSKAKTINGLGLSVTSLPDSEEYLNTTVNGVNLQVDFGPFFIFSILLVHSIFETQVLVGFSDSSYLIEHKFQTKLVTNGVNIRILNTVYETTNGISLKLMDLDKSKKRHDYSPKSRYLSCHL
jgi:hypothetical protein